MNKKILFLILLGVLVLPIVVSAQVPGGASDIAGNIRDLAITLGEAVIVIGWVVAGILYLLAAGSPEKIKTAKGAMIAALIGTVLVVIAVGGYAVIKAIVESALNTGT